MTLREHVEAIVEALPPEGAVSLPVATLRKWLLEDDCRTDLPKWRQSADLTVERVADALGVGPSRARVIIRENQEELRAYRRGRRWYVPLGGLTEWQRAQCEKYEAKRASVVGSVAVDFEALRSEVRSNRI